MKMLRMMIIFIAVSVAAQANDTLFVADFEAGDLSEWDLAVSPGTLIFEVSETAAQTGTYGFHVKFDPDFTGTWKANLNTTKNISFEVGEKYKISFNYQAIIPDPAENKASMIKAYDSQKVYVNNGAIHMAYSSTSSIRYETTFTSNITDPGGYVLFTFRNNPTNNGEFYIDDFVIEKVIVPEEPLEPGDFTTRTVTSDSSIIWQQFGPGMSGNNKSAFWHPTDPDVLFIGPNMGNSYVSFDRGKTYESLLNEDESDFKRGRRGPIELTCIDFSRQDPDFGMCTDERNEGMYVTMNHGRNWARLETSTFNDIYVDAVAVDPKDDNIWYVGAGQMRNLANNHYPNSEPLGTLADAVSVKKIWKSTNKGLTWALINTGLEDKTEVETMFVDPVNSDIVYASTNTGFYKSFNGGDSWEKKNSGLDYTVLRTMDYWYDQAKDSLVMIVFSNPMWKIDGTTLTDSIGGLFRSTDRGESWEKIVGDIALDMRQFQGNSDIEKSYFRVAGYTFGMSADAFKASYPVLPSRITMRFNTIEIDPKDPNNLYMNNEYSNSSENNFKPGQVWRSTDGGITWHVCFRNGKAWLPGSSDYDYWVTTRNNPMGTNISLRYLDEWMDRDFYERKGCNFVKFNVDGSVLHTQMAKISVFSYDNGETWVDIDDEFTEPGSHHIVGGGNSNVPGHGFFQHEAIPNKVFCAAGENQLCITTNDGYKVREGAQAVLPVRISSNETSLSTFAIDPQDTSIHYAMFFRQALRGKLVRSTNNGLSWSTYGDAVPTLGTAGVSSRTHQLHLTIDPVNTRNMYFVVPKRALDIALVGDSEYGIGVHRSKDRGVNWEEINSGLPASKDATMIAIDPENSNILYVCIQHSNGGLFKSIDSGDSWTEVVSTSSIAGTYGINDIHFAKNGKVYITSGSKNAGKDNGGLWVSEDDMLSWTRIFDFPWTYRVETANWDPNTIVVSTLSNNNIEGINAGTYLSKDGGESWAKINIGNGQSDRVNDIAIDNYRPGRYYASTYGSGWYVAQDTNSFEIVPTESLLATPVSVLLTIGEKDTLNVNVMPVNATFDNLSWSSANPSIVSVNSLGILTAKEVGTSQVTATHIYSGLTAQIAVEVLPIQVSSVMLDVDSIWMDMGADTTLSVEVQPEDAGDRSVTWSSENSSIATVDQNGNITAETAGEVRVMVSSNSSVFSDTVVVTVADTTSAVGLYDSGTDIKLYPNPVADDILYIKGIYKTSSFSVYDLYGREVLNGRMTDNQVDVSVLTPGLYLLKLKSDNKTSTAEFIIGRRLIP